MAINFLDNVQINQNQLLGARLQVETADANISSPVSGQIIYNSATNLFKYYNGTDWIDPSAGTYTGWTITGDSGTTANVTSGSGVDFVGGLGITTTSNGFNLSIDLDEATATTRGGIELFSNTDQTAAASAVSATANRTYGLQLNSSGQGVVNVPWTDNSGAEITFIASSGSDSTISSGGSVTFAQGSGITTTNDGSGTITIAATNAGTMSSFTLAGGTGTSQTISDGDTVTINGGTLISTVAGATDKVNINHDSVTRTNTTAASTLTFGGTFNAIDLVTSTAQGHITAGNTRTFTMPAAPTNTTYDFNATALAANVLRLNLDASGSGTDSSVIVSSNTTGNIALVRTSSSAVTVGLTDDVTLVGELTVSGTGQSSFGGKVTGVTPTASLDLATKGYVDNALAGSGSLIFQGGYDAASNTPNLDNTPTLDILKGWTYVVTVAGNFYTEVVEVGDLLIAEQDAPTALADWTTVQNNVDVASLSVVGIGNVNAQTGPTAGNQMTGIDVRYSSGTAQVGIDIRSQDNYTAGSTDVDNDFLLISQATDVSGETINNKISLNSLQTAIGLRTFSGTSASGTTHTFTHNLNTRNVMVQLFDTSSFETVYATVVRTSVNVVTVTTAATADITCLISEV